MRKKYLNTKKALAVIILLGFFVLNPSVAQEANKEKKKEAKAAKKAKRLLP